MEELERRKKRQERSLKKLARNPIRCCVNSRVTPLFIHIELMKRPDYIQSSQRQLASWVGRHDSWSPRGCTCPCRLETTRVILYKVTFNFSESAVLPSKGNDILSFDEPGLYFCGGGKLSVLERGLTASAKERPLLPSRGRSHKSVTNMSAQAQMRAMLDQLMGTGRDGEPNSLCYKLVANTVV